MAAVFGRGCDFASGRRLGGNWTPVGSKNEAPEAADGEKPMQRCERPRRRRAFVAFRHGRNSVPIAGRLRRTPFAPYPMTSDGLPCRVRWAIRAWSAAGPVAAATTSPTAAAAFCAISRTTWDMTTRTPHFRIDAAGALCFRHGPLAPPGRASAMSARGPLGPLLLRCA